MLKQEEVDLGVMLRTYIDWGDPVDAATKLNFDPTPALVIQKIQACRQDPNDPSPLQKIAQWQKISPDDEWVWELANDIDPYIQEIEFLLRSNMTWVAGQGFVPLKPGQGTIADLVTDVAQELEAKGISNLATQKYTQTQPATDHITEDYFRSRMPRFQSPGAIVPHLGQLNIVFGAPGGGKTTELVTEMAKDDKATIFLLCLSNEQAEEKAATFQKDHGNRVLWYPARAYMLKKKYNIVPEMTPFNHLSPGGIDETATKAKMLVMAQFQTKRDVNIAWNLCSGPGNQRLNGKIVVTTHFRYLELWRRGHGNKVPKGSYVIVDDASLEDSYRYIPIMGNPGLAHYRTSQGDPLKQVNLNNECYYEKPYENRLFAYSKDVKLVVTTAEWLTKTMLKWTWEHDYQKDISDPDFVRMFDFDPRPHRLTKGDVSAYGTKFVASALDGMLLVWNEWLKDCGYNFNFVADGLAARHNHSLIKGKNTLMDEPLIAKISYPHWDKVWHLFQEQDRKGLPGQKKELVVCLMTDQMNQAIGRNAGYRYRGQPTIVLIDQKFGSDVIQGSMFEFEQVFPKNNNVKATKEFMQTGEYAALVSRVGNFRDIAKTQPPLEDVYWMLLLHPERYFGLDRTLEDIQAAWAIALPITKNREALKDRMFQSLENSVKWVPSNRRLGYLKARDWIAQVTVPAPTSEELEAMLEHSLEMAHII